MDDKRLSRFLDSLEQSRLLSGAQMRQLRRQVAAADPPLTADSLARILIRQKHLTEWQARQLTAGQTGFILKHYRLQQPVGKGGMGHVFRAVDSRDNSVVAVKVMARNLTENETLVSRFRREIRAATLLRSRHVVRAVDAGRVGRIDFMVMEFVNGDQLDRIAARLKTLPPSLACDIIRQAALGLQDAHEQSMVHRDIKPGNIIINWEEDGTGTVKLMDMGLVRILNDDSDETTVTRAGQVMGTPDYMSPEQGWDTAQVDIRGDIYSLGCTMYRLLTGEVPFSGTNPLQLLSQRVQRDAPSVLTLDATIPDSIASIVSRMTLRDPDQRFSTPAEVAEALRPFCEPLTKTAMQEAARQSDGGSGEVVFPVSDSNLVDENDATYRRFLSEMQHDAACDLMEPESTGSSAVAAPQTLPVVLDTTSSGESAGTPRLRTRRRRTSILVPVIVLLGAGLLCLFGFLLAASSGNPDGDEQNGTIAEGSPAPERNLKLVTPEAPQTAEAGSSFSIEVTASDDSGVLNALPEGYEFRLGNSAPVRAAIDRSSGLLTWELPTGQSAAEHRIPVEIIRTEGDTTRVVASGEIPVAVQAMSWTPQLEKEYRDTVRPGDPWRLSLTGDPPKSLPARDAMHFAFDGRQPAGMQMNAATGLLQWTPDDDDIGRHEFSVVIAAEEGRFLAGPAQIRVVVLPSEMNFRMPPVPDITAKAGDALRQPILRPLITRQRRLVVELADPRPEGMQLNSRTGVLTWNVPADASGEVTVKLRARLLPPGVTFSPDSDIETEFQVRISPATGSPTDPDEPQSADNESDTQFAGFSEDPQVLAAVEELEKTYRRSINAARTAADKAQLAGRLFDSAIAASEEPGRRALIDLAGKIADDASAWDIRLRRIRLLAEDNPNGIVRASAAALHDFRSVQLTPLQQDLIPEMCLRLMGEAVTAGLSKEADTFLNAVEQVTRNPAVRTPALVEDLKAMRELTDQWVDNPAGAAAGAQRDELTRILAKWQFQLVSESAGRRAFFSAATQTNATPIDQNGRSLWQFTPDAIRLESPREQAVVGILSEQQTDSAYVLRMSVAPETTSLTVLTGAEITSDNRLAATRITLSGAAFGTITADNSDGTRRTAARPNAASPVRSDRMNHVELTVAGNRVALRVNGVPVSSAVMEKPVVGSFGLVADLDSPPHPVRLIVRDLRILRVP